MKILIFISTLILINSNFPIINMCGKIGEYKEPENETDCFKGNNTFGGKCCYVRFEEYQKSDNENTSYNLIQKSVCISVPSASKKDIDLAKEVAFRKGYSITVKCNEKFLKINLFLFILLIMIFA